MSIVLRKVGPCKCEGICKGDCKADSKNNITNIAENTFDIKQILKRIYCINLPESVERRLHILKILKTIKKENDKAISIIFIKAISPKDKFFQTIRQDNQKVDNGYSPRCYCNENMCSKHSPRLLREVEIAISISHLQAYQRVLKNDDKLALICEDDVIFLPNLIDILSKVLEPIKEELLSDKPVIIFCGGFKNNKGLTISDPNKFSLKSSKNGSYSNYAYIVNKQAAIVLKQKAFPITRPDDSYKRYLIVKQKLTAYQITPSLVAELSSGINSPAVYNRLSKESSVKQLDHLIRTEIRRPNVAAVADVSTKDNKSNSSDDGSDSSTSSATKTLKGSLSPAIEEIIKTNENNKIIDDGIEIKLEICSNFQR